MTRKRLVPWALLSLPLAATLFVTDASAADRDVYDKTTAQQYAYSQFINEDDSFNNLMDLLEVTPSNYVFEWNGTGYNYDSLFNSFVTNNSNFELAIAEAVQEEIPTQQEELKVESVSAINGIAANADIEIVFGQALDATTISSTNIYLVNENGVRQSATVAYDAATKKVTLNPAIDLVGGKKYTLKIENVKGADGETLAAAYTKEFTVGLQPVVTNVQFVISGADTTVQSGNAIDPANDDDQDIDAGALTADQQYTGGLGVVPGGDPDRMITVNFSKAMDNATLTSTNVKLYNITDSTYIPATINPAANGLSMTVAPVSSFLAQGKAYKLIIGSNAADLAGNKFTADYNLDFFVESALNWENNVRVADVTTAAAGNSITMSGAAKINPALTAQPGSYPILVQLDMNQELDATTVNTNSVYLTKKGSTDKIAGTVTYDNVGFLVKFTPSQALDEQTEYVLTMTTDVKTKNGAKLPAAKTVNFKTGDFTKPSIVSTSPAAGASAVATDAKLVVELSENVAPASITLGDAGGKFSNGEISLYNETTRAWVNISGWASSFDTTTKKLTITPAAGALAPNNSYTLYLQGGTAGVADTAVGADGTTAAVNVMAADYSATFTVAGDATAPTVKSATSGNVAITNGVTNVPTNQNIVLTFNDKDVTPVADAAFGATTAARLINVGTGADVAAVHFEVVDGGAQNDTLVVKTSGNPLTAGTKYRLTLTNGITDAAGNTMSPVSYEFVAGAGPRPTTLTPAEAATNHAVASDITVVLATGAAALEVDANTVNANTVKLCNAATNTEIPAVITLNNDIDGLGPNLANADNGGIITINPASDLDGSTQYMVMLSKDIKDTNGNQLAPIAGNAAADFQYLFKTVDTVKPTVVSTNIDNGATDVQVGTNVTVKFSEKVVADNNVGTQAIPADGTGVVQLATYADYADGAIGAPLAIAVSGNNTDEITINPAANLAENTKYVLVVFGDDTNNNVVGIADTADNPLASNYVLTFTTSASDTTAPAFANSVVFDADGTFPAGGTAVNKTVASNSFNQGADNTDFIGLVMDEAVDVSGATVTAKNITDDKNVGVLAVTAVADVDPAAGTQPGFSVSLATALENGKFYDLTITGAKDAAGNVVAPFVVRVKGL